MFAKASLRQNSDFSFSLVLIDLLEQMLSVKHFVAGENVVYLRRHSRGGK